MLAKDGVSHGARAYLDSRAGGVLRPSPPTFSPDSAATVIAINGSAPCCATRSPGTRPRASSVRRADDASPAWMAYAKFQVADGSTFEVFPSSKGHVRNNRINRGRSLDLELGRIRSGFSIWAGVPNHNRCTRPSAIISVRAPCSTSAWTTADSTLLVVEEGQVEVTHRHIPQAPSWSTGRMAADQQERAAGAGGFDREGLGTEDRSARRSDAVYVVLSTALQPQAAPRLRRVAAGNWSGRPWGRGAAAATPPQARVAEARRQRLLLRRVVVELDASLSRRRCSPSRAVGLAAVRQLPAGAKLNLRADRAVAMRVGCAGRGPESCLASEGAVRRRASGVEVRQDMLPCASTSSDSSPSWIRPSRELAGRAGRVCGPGPARQGVETDLSDRGGADAGRPSPDAHLRPDDGTSACRAWI